MIDQRKVIDALRHRSRMLEQFQCDEADCRENARAFGQAEATWTRQGYPEIAKVAGHLRIGWNVAAQAQKLGIKLTLIADAPPPVE